MQLIDLDGFLAALVAGPGKVATSLWLSEVWGGSSPRFASEREASLTVGAIVARHTQIAEELGARPRNFTPLFAMPADARPNAFQWAAGFRDAVRLSAEDWAPVLRPGPHRRLLLPIAAYWTEEDDMSCLEGVSDETLDRSRAQSGDAIRAAVIALYRFWRRFETQQFEIRRKDQA